MVKSFYNILETLVCICSEDKGSIWVLLRKKKDDPFGGMWVLPGEMLSNFETLEECASEVVSSATGVPSTLLFQSKAFSDLKRDPNDRVIAFPFVALTIKDLVDYKDVNREYEWFNINDLPPMGYDHKKIVVQCFFSLKMKILVNQDDVLFKLFPRSFTLPEFQSFFEMVLEKKLDRRNFRKKLISENIVSETGEMLSGRYGRPSKLYKLNSKF